MEKSEDEIFGKKINYSFKLGENIFQRIEKNLHLSTFLNSATLTKQKWLLNAIQEKLEMDEENQDEAIPKQRQLVVRIDNRLNEKLKKRLYKIKQYRISYSKKQWLLEAILEKLDREETTNKTRLEKTLNKM